jgi:hypothetical protein
VKKNFVSSHGGRGLGGPPGPPLLTIGKPVWFIISRNAFSAMKLIKNYLPNTMTDERLSALTLMYIHPQIDINIDEVIDRFLDKPIKRKLLQ